VRSLEVKVKRESVYTSKTEPQESVAIRQTEKLEVLLNNLKGEVISIAANVKPIFQGMGATAKVDFLPIVEKLKR